MSTIHGHTRGGKATPEFRCWNHMLSRCFNPNVENYKYYGGRGITVCERWRNSFEAFLSDMGPRPTLKHSIERNKTDGNYEPANCRWATKAEQSRNMRSNRMVEFQGKTMIFGDACALAGIARLTVFQRLKRGWTIERALTTPVRGA